MREKLSKNFYRDEVACKGKACCNHSAPVHPELINGIQELRNIVGAPLNVISGFRCNRHNAKVPNAAPNSFHTLGMAADISCKKVSSEKLALLAEIVTQFNVGGIGVYKSWIHVDVRKTGMARWRG